jgi:hypothetical protein
MEYLRWNEVIADYFFNPGKAGKEVLLYVTRDEISELGIKKLNFPSKEESWEDYCNALRRGIKYTGPKLLSENIRIAIDEWKNYSRWIFEKKNDFPFHIDGIHVTNKITSITYPIFIAFIPALIIPLTENNTGVRANSYYTPLSDFLEKNNIAKGKEDTPTFSKIEPLWSLLEKWSTVDYRTDLGFFTERNFGNPFWKHVGKPFSQCILTPKNIRDIPKLFWNAGIAPFAFVSHEVIVRMVVRYGSKHAGFSHRVTEIMNDRDNPLRKVICDIVKREYDSWTGDVLDYDDDGQDLQLKPKSGWSYGTLLSAFSLSHKDEAYEHYYHLYSKNDIPGDLNFNGHPVFHLTNGYSERMPHLFDQNLVWTDNENKWKATPSASSILIYISGSYFGLPSDTYIETDKISRASKMYLLCPADKQISIEDWGKTFAKGDFNKIDYDYIPSGFFLYSFKNPVETHPEEELLQISNQKSLELKGGVKMANREYLNVSLPDVWITGADGRERLFLQYSDDSEQVGLERNVAIPEVFFLPSNIQPNRDFRIVCDTENLSGTEIPYMIVDSSFSPLDIIEENLAKRNRRGELCSDDETEFVRGSNAMYTNWSQQLGSLQDFLPLHCTVKDYRPCDQVYELSGGNLILEFLTLKRNANLEDFSGIMEHVAAKTEAWRSNSFTINPKYLKQQAINYYDYSGYLDYDYSSDKITIHKPQLVIIPSKSQVEAILIGGRTQTFVNELITATESMRINIEIHSQARQLERFLLPDTIKLTPAECQNSTQAWVNLRKLAQSLHIEFYTLKKHYECPQIVQFGLQDFGENLKGYKAHLIQNKVVDIKDFAWARKTFNPVTLLFEKDITSQLDKSLSLHEYYLQYRYKYILWIDGISYEVDRNWGRFLLLAELNKHIIFYAKDAQLLVIPRAIQLPRLIAESITLLSGFTPSFKKITVNGTTEVYQVYQNVPKLFAENLFKKLNQTIQYITL